MPTSCESSNPLILDNLRVLRKLGQGNSTVYLVVHRQESKQYAMKVMSISRLVQKNKLRRLQTELHVLMDTDHPLLTPLYYAFRTQTHIFLVLGYAPGGTLYNHVYNGRNPKGRVPESTARFLVSELVQAIEYLHVKGYVYRDLKPENILLTSEGHVMLTDFDLVMEDRCAMMVVSSSVRGGQSGPPVTTSLHRSSSFVGTPEYMAPEVVSGCGHTQSVDWWAVGILAYELLVGKTPFCGQTREETLATISSLDAKVNLHFPDDVFISKEFVSFLHGMLQVNPTQRLGSGPPGCDEIKRHPWLSEINFAILAKPPKDLLATVQARIQKSHAEEVEGSEITMDFTTEQPTTPGEVLDADLSFFKPYQRPASTVRLYASPNPSLPLQRMAEVQSSPTKQRSNSLFDSVVSFLK